MEVAGALGRYLTVPFAACQRLQAVGEAARKVSPEFREAHPEIPWPQIIGMRHRLVHEYFRIIPEKVWDVVEHHVAPLIAALEPLVPPPDQGEGVQEEPPTR